MIIAEEEYDDMLRKLRDCANTVTSNAKARSLLHDMIMEMQADGKSRSYICRFLCGYIIEGLRLTEH